MPETKTQVRDNTWYVAIMKFFENRYYSFIGAGGKSYHGFSEVAKRNGIKIVAERFDATDLVVDKISGFDEHRQRTNDLPLKDLTDKLNRGEISDAQKALDELCKTAA